MNKWLDEFKPECVFLSFSDDYFIPQIALYVDVYKRQAVDCAIHVPLTTPEWVETFSLAVIQPQITKKPVIGDDSGSVPYQIGFDDMIVPEGNVEALHNKIEWVLNHKEKASAIGLKMYKRTHDCFEVKHLNSMFYDTIVEDVQKGKYDENKHDMTKYTPCLLYTSRF